jgi:hypothetical protein
MLRGRTTGVKRQEPGIVPVLGNVTRASGRPRSPEESVEVLAELRPAGRRDSPTGGAVPRSIYELLTIIDVNGSTARRANEPRLFRANLVCGVDRHAEVRPLEPRDDLAASAEAAYRLHGLTLAH